MKLRRFLLLQLLAFYAVALPFLLVPTLLLLFQAETAAGRLCGLAALSALGFPLTLLYARWARAKGGRGRMPAIVCSATAAALLPILFVLAPPGEPPAGAAVGSRFLGEAGYRRVSPCNLLPEIDQIKLGTYLIPSADPILTSTGGRRLRGITLPIYRAMEADPAFHALGSVMNYAYAELYGGTFDVGHFYEYVPAHAPSERLPAILFLHGSCGNFKAYLWVWKQFADRHRFVIVCPSFGFGNWNRQGGAEAVERARRVAVARLPVDPGRIYLAGLSNGGIGVSRAGALTPAAYRALIFISPVLDGEFLGRRSFQDGWRGRPIFVLHGARDDRVPESYVAKGVRDMREAGPRVTYRVFSEEDHFLFFSSRERALKEIATWIEGVEGGP